jgi:glycosyltransferase involved in cell wall biosynthesis
MTRIQFWGDLAATGFGTVTADLGRELLNLGHDVRFVSQNEWAELPEPFASRTFQLGAEDLDPQRAAVAGMSSLAMLMDRIVAVMEGRAWSDGWAPEAAIILGDFVNVRLLVGADETTQAAFAKVPTFHYVPIEGVNLPPAWAGLWAILRPVAMTNFGAGEIAKIVGYTPPMVYHGVDTEQFRPATRERPIWRKGVAIRDKASAKRALGWPAEMKVILRTDRNMPRKRYAAMIRGLAPVLAQRPDTALVLHCLAHDEGGDLRDELSKYPEALRSRILLTDGGGQLSRDDLTVLYNAADLYVSTSAEGFGLTIAEAMACGTPAVGLNYSAVPEVIGSGGGLVRAAPYDNEYGFCWALPDERQLGEVVSTLLDNDLERVRRGRTAAEHVRKSFQWSRAAIQFSGLIREATVSEVAA